jgi:hypothetical protein
MRNEMETQNTYHLEGDLSIAAYLLSKGHILLGLELVGTRFSFKFENTDGSASLAVSAYTQGGMVEALRFAEAIKQLKSLLYAEKFRNGNGNGNERNTRFGR